MALQCRNMSGRGGQGGDIPRNLMMGAFSNLCNELWSGADPIGEESSGYSVEFHVIPAAPATCRAEVQD